MWLADSLQTAADRAVNAVKTVAEGAEEAVSTAWNDTIAAAKSAAGSAVSGPSDGTQVSAGSGAGAPEGSAGIGHGALPGGPQVAGASVLQRDAAVVGHRWNELIDGDWHRPGWINRAWVDSVRTVADSVATGVADGTRDLRQGGKKAASEVWNGAVAVALSAERGVRDASRDVYSAFGKGASDLSVGIRRGDPLGGLQAAGSDVLHGGTAAVSHLWNEWVIKGDSALWNGVNGSAHDIGAAAQNGYDAGVKDVAAGVGEVAGGRAARAFRGAAMLGEVPFKTAAQFEWGLAEGEVAAEAGMVTGTASFEGFHFRFMTDGDFRRDVLNADVHGATYVAEHPLDAAAGIGSAIENFAVGLWQGAGDANNRGDFAEYIGQGAGQVGFVAVTTVVSPEEFVSAGAGLDARGVGELANMSGVKVLDSAPTGARVGDATADAGSAAARGSGSETARPSPRR